MTATIRPAPVRKSVRVAAPAERAFEIFTAGIGRWFERGIDGVECEIGKVLIWDPPSRLVLNWQLNADFSFDPALITEVEVRFIADGENATRVELEHRDLERLGDRAEAFRQQIDSPGGWDGLLQLFSQTASQTQEQSS